MIHVKKCWKNDAGSNLEEIALTFIDLEKKL